MFFKRKKETPPEKETAPSKEKISHHFSHERTLTAEGWHRKLKEKNRSKK